MLFEDKKLELESIENLFQCSIDSVEPYTLMLAPVYVLMRMNQKLVSVKAPLDFFTPDEIQKLKAYDVFYLPRFAKSSVRFQTAARVIRKIMTIQKGELDPAPFEVSKEVFNQLAPLWGKDLFVEPFFMSIFADELCDQLDPELMLNARENSVSRHDHGLLLSGTVIFLLLHLGWYHLEMLNSIRSDIYKRTIDGEEWSDPVSELDYIIHTVHDLLGKLRSISIRELEFCQYDFFRMIYCRVSRWSKLNPNLKYDSETIYGEGGFAA